MEKLKFWERIGYGLFAVTGIAAFILIGRAFDLDAEKWAAWVQAVGAIAAIGVAIWVSYRQHEKERARDEEREADEVQNLLYSIRDELEVLVEQFQENVGDSLAKSAHGTPFWTKWIQPENPFLIYTSIAGKIGKIDNHDLRRKIVITYSSANNFLITFRMHNEFLDKAVIANRRGISGKSEDLIDSKLTINELTIYSDALRAHYKELMINVGTLLAKLPVPQHRALPPEIVLDPSSPTV